MYYKLYIKRLLDLTISILLLCILLPLILIIITILILTNKGKPFFTQNRPGKNEKKIRVIKFKTMTDSKDSKGQLLPDHLRITSFGEVMRKTSLDEIPQLINVIKGDMSLVGPRPLLIKYLPYYSNKEKIRHSVKPGITGLAQISGRNLLNWDQRLEKDIEYVNNLSLKLDVKIVLITLKKVIKRDGVVIAAGSQIIDLDEERTKNP